jgi:hypothetical protein
VINTVEGGQRPVVGQQVHGDLGPKRLEGRADEPGRVHAVVLDGHHSHHAVLLTRSRLDSGRAVTGVAQQPAEVDDHLDVDVLSLGRVEDLVSAIRP